MFPYLLSSISIRYITEEGLTEVRSQVFTRASTSPASPGDSCGGVRLWGWALLFLCGGCLRVSWLLLPQPVYPEGGAHQWTLAGIWAGGLGGASPESCPSTRTWGACCAPRAYTGCSQCCTSAALPNWSLHEKEWREGVAECKGRIIAPPGGGFWYVE